jgi:AcrR family transcriptional regulator
MPPEQIARERVERLHEAIVEAVAAQGFEATTIDQLVAAAGVSKSTFYRHFENKQECFLSAFEQIIGRLGERVARAFQGPGDLRDRMVASLTLFMAIAVEEPAVVAFVVIHSLSLGTTGMERRERASHKFEEMLEQTLAQFPAAATMPPLTSRAVVGGVRGLAYRRLRAGTQDELPALVDPLIDWALTYARPEGELTRAAVAAAAQPVEHQRGSGEATLPWDEPADSPRSRRSLSQRERLIRGAAQAAYERGYEGLSIPAISGAAGVSNQTFYEHFANKDEAFLAAFDELAREAFETTATAYAAAGDKPEALGIGIRAMLEYIAGNKLFAKLAFFEIGVGGPGAIDRGTTMLQGFTVFLAKGTAPSAVTKELDPTAQEAIGSGIWEVLLYELASGRREQLPELAPEVTRLAVAPLEQD